METKDQDQSYFFWAKHKLGDGVIAVLDELKFWGEVIAEFMEWDESSSQRIAAQYKEEMKEQLKEVDDITAEVRRKIEREERAELKRLEKEESDEIKAAEGN